MTKKKKLDIFGAGNEAKKHAKKVFAEIDFKFRGDTDKEIEAQMDKVFKAILNAWIEGWLSR